MSEGELELMVDKLEPNSQDPHQNGNLPRYMAIQTVGTHSYVQFVCIARLNKNKEYEVVGEFSGSTPRISDDGVMPLVACVQCNTSVSVYPVESSSFNEPLRVLDCAPHIVKALEWTGRAQLTAVVRQHRKREEEQVCDVHTLSLSPDDSPLKKSVTLTKPVAQSLDVSEQISISRTGRVLVPTNRYGDIHYPFEVEDISPVGSSVRYFEKNTSVCPCGSHAAAPGCYEVTWIDITTNERICITNPVPELEPRLIMSPDCTRILAMDHNRMDYYLADIQKGSSETHHLNHNIQHWPNMDWIDRDTIVYPLGKTVTAYNFETRRYRPLIRLERDVIDVRVVP
jgi:hypothetical protein